MQKIDVIVFDDDEKITQNVDFNLTMLKYQHVFNIVPLLPCNFNNVPFDNEMVPTLRPFLRQMWVSYFHFK